MSALLTIMTILMIMTIRELVNSKIDEVATYDRALSGWPDKLFAPLELALIENNGLQASDNMSKYA